MIKHDFESGEYTYEKVLALMEENERNLSKRFIETEELFKNTERLLAQKSLEADERFKETERFLKEQSKEVERSQKETDKFLKELSEKTDKRLVELGSQIGGFGNKFGSFTEGLFAPSVIRILEDVFECKETTNRAKFKNNGSSIEIDVLGFSENDCFVVEIKSKLRVEHIKQLEKTLNSLNSFSKKFAMYNKIGIMAATEYNEEIVKKVISSGFYFIGVNDYLGELRIVPDFKPRIWR